jgi:hypothetical protein
MKFRKMLATGLLVGIATVGVGGVAAAQNTGSGGGTTGPSTRRCVVTLVKLEREKAELEGKIDVLQRERNAALQHHDFALARRLEHDIVKLQARKAVVELKIRVVKAHCN